MARRTGPTPTARRMEKLLEAQERSGLSLAGFARQLGLPEGRLRWWRHQLRRRQRPGREVRRAALVPVKLTPAPAVAVNGCVVELPDGVRVHVPRGCPAADLREVLAALRSPC